MANTMRVLHLPTNIASIPLHTVQGLSEIGVEAFGLIIKDNLLQSAEGLKVIDVTRSRQWSPLWFWTQIIKGYYFVKWILWADVIHWYFSSKMLPFGLDLKLIKVLNKPAVVEWLGSDIRIPEIEFADNPYYRKVFKNGYEYQTESYHRSRETQRRFVRAGFLPLTIPCMIQYLQKDLCPQFCKVGQRIMLTHLTPCYPNPEKRNPLVVHAPSAPVAKGTPAVLIAIEQLKKKYDFEFVLIQGMPRKKALEIVQAADIYLDQFIIGYYGMAAIEAMAFGKPVLCYLKPSLIHEVPPDLPIINANPDNLAEILEPLLQDGKLRQEIGERSRIYVEKYHDAVKWAYMLLDIYRELIEKKRRCHKC
jgi:hypothetical protein